jgi:hypothetical protein
MFLTMIASADVADPASRHIDLDVARATKPFDRFFDLSVGSDYPGTLIRDDSQAQLKTAVDELGFRYIRFHAIFHDVSEYRAESKTVKSTTTGPRSTSSMMTCSRSASSHLWNWASRRTR